MVKSKFAAKAGILLAGALTLAGCTDNTDRSITDTFVSDLISETDDLNTILRRHIAITDQEGLDLGVVFIKEINLKDGEYCADYSGINMAGRIKAKESARRTVCAARPG